MKRLLKYLKKYQKESILAPLFKLLEALMDLIVPLIVAYVIDEANYNFKQTVNNAFIMILRILLALVLLSIFYLLIAVRSPFKDSLSTNLLPPKRLFQSRNRTTYYSLLLPQAKL